MRKFKNYIQELLSLLYRNTAKEFYMVKCSCYCCKTKTNCAQLISHPLKCHIGQGHKSPVPHLIWQPTVQGSCAFQQTDVCARSSDAQGRTSAAHLSGHSSCSSNPLALPTPDRGIWQEPHHSPARGFTRERQSYILLLH